MNIKLWLSSNHLLKVHLQATLNYTECKSNVDVFEFINHITVSKTLTTCQKTYVGTVQYNILTSSVISVISIFMKSISDSPFLVISKPKSKLGRLQYLKLCTHLSYTSVPDFCKPFVTEHCTYVTSSVMLKLLNVTHLYQLLCSPHINSSLLQIITSI
jgi:hypothetical protein